MLDLRRLHLLSELHRRGTIAAVAQASNHSASAVSQQLAVLEKEVGVPLLEPFGRRVRLTPHALLLVEHAGRLFAEMERAEAAVAASGEETVGTLRVACFQTAALTLVPATLLRLRHLHPGLRVEVTEMEPEDALPALLSHRFDLVMVEEFPGQTMPRPRGTQWLDLFTDELTLAVPDSWPEQTLGALAARPFVLEAVGSRAHEWAVGACRHAGFEPDAQFSSTDLQIHLALVEHGLAASLMPLLAGGTTRPGITVHPLPGAPARRILAAVRTGAAGHPMSAVFVDTLRRVHDAAR